MKRLLLLGAMTLAMAGCGGQPAREADNPRPAAAKSPPVPTAPTLDTTSEETFEASFVKMTAGMNEEQQQEFYMSMWMLMTAYGNRTAEPKHVPDGLEGFKPLHGKTVEEILIESKPHYEQFMRDVEILGKELGKGAGKSSAQVVNEALEQKRREERELRDKSLKHVPTNGSSTRSR